VRVLQHFAQREPIAAAEHQHALGAGRRLERRMHQRLVVAVFVARRELQVAVQVEARVVQPAREHDALERRGFLRARCCRRNRLASASSVSFCAHTSPLPAARQHQPAAHHQRAGLRQFGAVAPGHPQADARIEHAEHHGGARQPEQRREHQRKQQRHRQRTQVIEGEHTTHQRSNACLR
jgi:hypothetical protein